MFSHDQILKLCILGKNVIEVMLWPLQCILSGYMMLLRLITYDINLNYLVEVVSVRFLHCKVTIFTFKINQCLGKRYFETDNILFLIILLPVNFSIHRWFLPSVIWRLANGNFLFYSFLLQLLNGIVL